MAAQKLLRFFAKIPYPLQEEVFESMIQKYHILKIEPKYQNLNRSHIYLQALLNVLEKTHNLVYQDNAKNSIYDLKEIQKQSALREKMIDTKQRKSAKKREKILGQYSSLIYQLRFEKKKEFTWIVMYLKRFHKFQVDHTYLYKLYPQIIEKMSIKSAKNEEKDK